MRRSGEGPDQRTLAPAGCGSKPGDAGRSIPKSMSPVSAGKARNAPALRQHRQVGQRAEPIPGTSLGEPPRARNVDPTAKTKELFVKSAKRERALDYSKLAACATSPPTCVGSRSNVRSN